MAKLEVIDGKQTNWCGLWWHPENCSFSSSVISLAQLKKFKGNVRLVVKKNKFFNKGENNRPNYTFCLRDAKADNPFVFEIEDIDTEDDYGDDEEKLYTYEDCKTVMRMSWYYANEGYPYGHFCVDDFV